MPKPLTTREQDAGEIIADYANAIKRLFRMPVFVTIVVRNPQDEVDGKSRYMVITRDDIDKVVATLQTSKTPGKEGQV